MPARVNNEASLLVPSRRSPRVPAPEKRLNTSPQSSQTLPPSSTTPDNSFNIRFYTPKTPSNNSPSRNASPDVPLTRRSTFQARPSRLSSVYTPAVKSPTSTHSSRRTRRTATLETPQTSFSDHDMSDALGSTGWTYGQYSGLGMDGTMDSRPSPSVSSMGTRASTRLRKPTAKALEAMQSQKKPRRLQKDAPAVPDSSVGASTSGPDPAPTSSPASPSAPAPTTALKRFPKITFKNVFKPASEPASVSSSTPESRPKTGPKLIFKSAAKPSPRANTRKGKKGKNALKSSLHRIQLTVGRAGQKLYELATVALGTDFLAPSDPEQFIQDLRAAQSTVDVEEDTADSDTHHEDDDTDVPAVADDAESIPPDDPERKVMLTFKFSAVPHVDQDSWTHTGRVNSHGEEVMLTPPGYSLDRAPHNYGDEALPYPPVRTRPDDQAMANDGLGFPPLLGDRNVPFGEQSDFQAEDVTEEQAQVRARKKKAAAPAEPSQKGGRKRRLPGAETAEISASSSAPVAPERGERAQKRRRGETVSQPASSKQTPRKTLAPRSAKAEPKTNAPSPSPVEEEAPSQAVQRLRITVKPPTAAEMQEEDSASGEEEDSTLARPAAGDSRQQAADLATEVETTQRPAISKGKKRAAALISNDEVTERSTSPAKRARAADSQVGTADAAAPRGRGHAVKRGHGSGRGGGRGRGASSSRGKPPTRGGKRGRGRG